MKSSALRTDDEGRRLIRDAIDETLVVEAAAGTGKTTELVNRILQVLASGSADVREIVAVTFTEKAAGELKLRLRQGLELRRQAAADRREAQRLSHAVQHLEEAHVSTIHGFCADLLRERPVEARIDPLFRVLTEGQAERLFDEAFTTWFQQHLENPPEGVRRSLRRSSRGFRPGDVDEDGPMERLRRAGVDLAAWRDFPAAWQRPSFDRRAAADAVVGLVHTLADISEAPSYRGDNLFVDTEPARRLSRDLRARAGEIEVDLDGLESLLVDLARNRDFKRGRKGSGAGYSKGVTRARVLEARDALSWALKLFQEHADADLAARLHGELRSCVDEYERLKVREGTLDFLDLLLRARDLVRDDAAVRRHFQGRFKRLFVDEFQDTDPLQAELLLLLASDDPAESDWRRTRPVPGKLFLVGDPKQSIYRFRRADIRMYRDVCDHLLARGATAVELRRSFRGTPNLQRAVNAAFAPVMDGNRDTLHAPYIPLESSRDEVTAQPSVVVLPVPRPYGQKFVSAREIEESLPDAAGAFVEWLVKHSGWTVTERRTPDVRIPLEARHICMLFRRFVSYGSDVTKPYVEALEARGIRHLLVGGKAFHDREEIETLRAALMAIEWPDDHLSVFATLRGGLFAIGDEELLEYYQHAGVFHPFRVPATLPDAFQSIREALALLASLHRERNQVPVADTLSTLLGRTRAHVGFVLRPAGEQVLANVLHVAELARRYELDGGMSFRGFVEALRDAASGGQATEAPILEEGSDGVRLMTVHKAKGLEFPVVVLADMTARLTPSEAARYVDADRALCATRIGGWAPRELLDHRELELDRERAEGERVAYVAATRARDLLVVPAVGDQPYAEGWVSPLNAAVYPAEGRRRQHQPAEGCPVFMSRDTVLERPDGDPFTPQTVCPGFHVLGSDATPYGVVWWSPEPGVLSLDVAAPLGLRRDDLMVRDVPPDVALQYRREYDDWRQARDRAIADASRPSVAVRTVSEHAAMQDAASPLEGAAGGVERAKGDEVEVGAVETIRVPHDPSRPGGVRFGTLVHAALAAVPLDADRSGIAAVTETQGRIVAAPADEVRAAAAAIEAALAHPLLEAARQAMRHGRCRREAPVTVVRDGVLIEGVLDLLFESDDGVTVVDFKTDRGAGEAFERYERQVALYADAVTQILGRPTRAVLMRM